MPAKLMKLPMVKLASSTSRLMIDLSEIIKEYSLYVDLEEAEDHEVEAAMGNLKEWHNDVTKIKKEILSIEASINRFWITSTDNTMARLTVLGASLQILYKPSRMPTKPWASSAIARLKPTP